jgi:uncharacterized protein (TIGR02217 family)
MPSFVNVVLDLGYDYGAIGGLSFQTTAIATSSGYEKRNSLWDQPLGRWQLGDRSGENALTIKQYEYLSGFHLARRGSAQGFLFLDWNDYRLKHERIGTGDGITKAFQLTKTYGDAGDSFTRLIQKPREKGAQVFVGSQRVPPEKYQLSEDTGILTLTTAPPNTVPILVSCQFYVPVRFEQDRLEARFAFHDPYQKESLYEVSSLSVVGIRP